MIYSFYKAPDVGALRSIICLHRATLPHEKPSGYDHFGMTVSEGFRLCLFALFGADGFP